MSYPVGGRSETASGTIYPARFVKLDTAHNSQVSQATAASGAGDTVYGVSQNWSSAATYSTSSTPLAAALVGQTLTVYIMGEETLLTLGSGGGAVGDKLKSDANGNGITTTTSADNVGAICLQAGVAGDTVKVLVTPFVVH